MTLREVFEFLEGIAMQIPDIRTTVVNDITKVNEMREVKYGIFGITQGQHTADETTITFSLNLFYIDRLVNGQDNEVQIQSHAIEILRQVLLKAADSALSVSDAQFTCFTQRFQDLCAGAWAVVTITTPVSDCLEI